jgi:hypothetical protein
MESIANFLVVFSLIAAIAFCNALFFVACTKNSIEGGKRFGERNAFE